MASSYKNPHSVAVEPYATQRGAHDNNPAGYLTAQVPTQPNANGTGYMSVQRGADGNINSVTNQMTGLGLHGQGNMVPNPYMSADGSQYVMSYTGAPLGVPAFFPNDNPSNMYPGQYMQGFQPAMFVPLHTGRPGIVHERSDIGSKDVPGLENRRSSYSTNESTPATPFFPGMPARDQAGPIAVSSERSSYTTPSPQQVVAGGGVQHPKGFFPIAGPLNADLDALLKRNPPIPHAVPAVFTPPENMKSLEQSLANHIPGNRNVYIRGLHPTTDDETLKKYAERFGRVKTSKAIIDNTTGACKG